MWFFTALLLVAVASNGSSAFMSEPVHWNNAIYNPFMRQYDSLYNNLRGAQAWRQYWPNYHMIPFTVSPIHQMMKDGNLRFPNWKRQHYVQPTEHVDINSDNNNNNYKSNNDFSVINEVFGSTSIRTNNAGSTPSSHTSHSYDGF